MRAAAATARREPNGLLLGLAAFGATGLSLAAWLLIVVGTIFPWMWSDGWTYTGLAMPGATIGTVATYATRRHVYFWVGLAITLIPLVAYVVLSANTPPAPHGWND